MVSLRLDVLVTYQIKLLLVLHQGFDAVLVRGDFRNLAWV